jgi:hypothetical protein
VGNGIVRNGRSFQGHNIVFRWKSGIVREKQPFQGPQYVFNTGTKFEI